jgi:hypothetical protein
MRDQREYRKGRLCFDTEQQVLLQRRRSDTEKLSLHYVLRGGDEEALKRGEKRKAE